MFWSNLSMGIHSQYIILTLNSTTIIMLTLTYIKINICIFWEGRGAFCLWCTSFWPKATSFLTYFVHKKYTFCTGLYSASRWNKPINVHFKFEGNWLEIFATDFFSFGCAYWIFEKAYFFATHKNHQDFLAHHSKMI